MTVYHRNSRIMSIVGCVLWGGLGIAYDFTSNTDVRALVLGVAGIALVLMVTGLLRIMSERENVLA